MEMTALGRTGISVSRLCLGTWQASGWTNSNDEMFDRVVRYGLDHGVTFIDTAPAYGDGHSERLVGRAISGRRHSVILATKFHHTTSRPDQIEAALEQSLRNLGTDYVDLYQQHWPPRNPPLEETIGALERLKERGLIRAIGVSNWMEPEWSEISDPSRIEVLQPCFSLLWRSIESTVLPLMRRHDIGVIAYSPLAQGILTGKISPETIPADWRAKNRLLSPERFPLVQPILEELAAVARDLGRTPAEVALRWALDTPGITSIIVGATSMEQLERNLGTFGWSLPPDRRARLDAVSAPLSAGLDPHDTLWGWHPRGTPKRPAR